MKSSFILFLFLAFCVAEGHLYAQKSGKKIIITGTVIDADSRPVANAFIMVDGRKTNIVTDDKGTYRIKVKPDAVKIGTVLFGAGLIEEEIAGREVINFIFNRTAIQPSETPEQTEDDQMVNTGYNEVKKSSLTTSVSEVSGKGPKNNYSSILEMLSMVPGVRVSGGGISVQDARNLNGSVAPLIVVDGIPSESLPDIHPRRVESIQVLKGAAAAIYGARGFGGVILITTTKE